MQTSSKKQKLLLEYLVSSVDTFALCKAIVKSSYFDPEYRKTVDFLHKYYDEYNSIPPVDLIEAETDTQLTLRTPTHDEIEYCTAEIESFCKFHAFRLAVLAAPKLMNDENYGEALAQMNDAMAVSLNRDLGIQYFEDPLSRLENAIIKPGRVSTLWKPFDEATDGGVGRQELVLFSANSGGGKSITLANLAANMLLQGLNVVYITLELSEELISHRFDTMFTNIPIVLWRDKYRDIAQSLRAMSSDETVGNLTIKHMPVGSNSNKIRSYLKEFYLKKKYMPDVLIVDYLDIMGANEKVSADNISEKDKLTTEQLREIMYDYNMIGATASQQNRSAIDAERLNQGHIAGGLTKVNAVDVYVSIILTPTMKASGEMAMLFLKTRNSDGDGKTIYLTWVNNTLRIVSPPRNHAADSDRGLTSKISQLKQQPKKSMSVIDLMNQAQS